MTTQHAPADGKPTPPPRTVKELESVTIRFCGDSGDGMQLTGGEFTKVSAIAGNDLATLPDFPAEIRAPAGTLAGVSGFQLQFSSKPVFTPGDAPDVLVAMNPAALKTNLPDLLRGGVLIVNTAAFTKPNLTKAGYTENPIDDEKLGQMYKLFKVDITGLTKKCLEDTDLNTKSKDRCKNFFALGMTFWMFNRPIEPEIVSINKKFGKKPELAAANIQVFKAGYHYGETAEIFTETIEVKAAAIEPGMYRNIMGNTATAVGLVTGCRLAEVPCFFAGYPITPASSILHELSNYRAYDVTTFQAEDEIAACSAAVGGSFGGAMGMTASSGPGIALKGEAMGLALSFELPLVIVSVQRGGPSTGLPTKTEQADLMQSLYGRNGESPIPILAARTPSDCFYTAIEAVRIAIKYMTPVMLLTDGYLANGAEPWKIPDLADLKPFPTKFRTDPENFQVFKRNEDTLARDWVKPGTPGLAHRVGGLEKDALTGNVSYDPENHEAMCIARQAKVDRVQQDMDPLETIGPDEGDLIVVGWGSTYGAITKAVKEMRAKGYSVSSVHIRWLSPLHPKLGELLKRFKNVVVAEMNLGQLVKVIRAEYLVDAEGLNKIQGKPFKIAEICAKIEERAGRAS